MNPASLAKYLARWAEPEASALPALRPRYHAGLVVPAFAEHLDLLDGYRAAATATNGRVLVVLIVNQAASAAGEARTATLDLLASLREKASVPSAPQFVHTEPEFDVLVVDRATPGLEIDEKCGVGHARKIGGDILLALAAQGRLELPFVFSSDADACLPNDYFTRAAEAQRAAATALLFPFRHVQNKDTGHVLDATQLYELSLRYHVTGLASAGSPYAYHSMGSALAAHVEAYAAVRGFPKRPAGEDFYLLDKLGKIGPIQRLAGDPITIRARRSTRVPFGTGPRVEQLLRDPSAPVDHPTCYRVLGLLLDALDAFANDRDLSVFERAFTSLPAAALTAASGALARSGLIDAARDAAAQVGTGDLRRRLHTWFDALRSLRFLHAVGELGFPKLPCREALELAPFTTIARTLPLNQALTELERLEAALPRMLGPAASSVRVSRYPT